MPFTRSRRDPSVFIFRPNRPRWQAPPAAWWPNQFWFGQATQLYQTPPPPPLLLHYQLLYNPNDPFAGPEILWDLVHPPGYARVRDRSFFKRWKKPELSSDALHPSVEKLWILSDHPVLAYWMGRWGPIVVRSEKITIEDVLQGIYTYLRTPLTREDLREVNSIPGNRKNLRYARDQRAKDSHEIEAVVIAHGYRRVDIVGGHRGFQGMRVAVLPDQTWRLYFGLRPGPIPRIP
ncbi:hypothetical protein BDZ97DRAFT_1812816 [Flammula alnicola]|nr:hypothetical protein BDZ97DRAFT_1812816 [Flammula alnicola]